MRRRPTTRKNRSKTRRSNRYRCRCRCHCRSRSTRSTTHPNQLPVPSPRPPRGPPRAGAAVKTGGPWGRMGMFRRTHREHRRSFRSPGRRSYPGVTRCIEVRICAKQYEQRTQMVVSEKAKLKNARARAACTGVCITALPTMPTCHQGSPRVRDLAWSNLSYPPPPPSRP